MSPIEFLSPVTIRRVCSFLHLATRRFPLFSNINLDIEFSRLCVYCHVNEFSYLTFVPEPFFRFKGGENGP